MSGRLYVGPGWGGVGSLYDERLAELEDLRAYARTGRHPKEEMRKARAALANAESLMARRQSGGAATASTAVAA